jgi:hypothetical protein
VDPILLLKSKVECEQFNEKECGKQWTKKRLNVFNGSISNCFCYERFFQKQWCVTKKVLKTLNF